MQKVKKVIIGVAEEYKKKEMNTFPHQQHKEEVRIMS